MKTSYPFEPLWECINRKVVHFGKGLVPKDIKDGCERFDVCLGSCRLSVFPSLGSITLDGQRMYEGEPGHLLWARIMQMQYGTQDTNRDCVPDCTCYMAGITSKHSDDFVRIFPDLTIHYPCRSTPSA